MYVPRRSSGLWGLTLTWRRPQRPSIRPFPAWPQCNPFVGKQALLECLGRTRRVATLAQRPTTPPTSEPVGETIMSLAKEAKAAGRSVYDALKEHNMIADVAGWLAGG